MTPEREALTDLIAALAVLADSARSDRALLGEAPADLSAFKMMSPLQQALCRSVLKCFEQLEDALARTVRTILKMLGYRLKGLSPLDIANLAANVDLVEDEKSWFEIVNLRNELVHEYPDDEAMRFERLSKVLAALPFLFDAIERVERAVQSRFEALEP